MDDDFQTKKKLLYMELYSNLVQIQYVYTQLINLPLHNTV